MAKEEIQDNSKYIAPALFLLAIFTTAVISLKSFKKPKTPVNNPNQYSYEYTLNGKIDYSKQCYVSEYDVKYCVNENNVLFVVDDFKKQIENSSPTP